MNAIINKLFIVPIVLGVLLGSSCKKLVEVDGPSTSMSGEDVYSNDLTASAALTGIYTKMSGSNITGGDLTSIGFICGLASDELTLSGGQFDPRLIAYYQNNQSSKNMGDYPWLMLYNRIYVVNAAIEKLSASKALTEKVKTQALGEAKFMRAFLYFYLVNLYGDVPLVLTSDYRTTMTFARTPQEQVWAQVITDLKEAQPLLSNNYLDGSLMAETPQRVRPNKSTATALLARSYLYTRDWSNAEIQADLIINDSSVYRLDSLNEVFTINSKEAIWQLQPVITGFNTQDAVSYIISPDYGPDGAGGVYISAQLLDKFEPGDKRKDNWLKTVNYLGTDFPFAYKYKLNTYGDNLNEFHTIFRLSEQYLIRAEARAMQDKFEEAREDIKVIRKRAGLENTTATDQDELIEAILHERQTELFTEWGHRWFDLKRTNTINNVMTNVTPLKGGAWSPDWQWFPVPFAETVADTNIKQNKGY